MEKVDVAIVGSGFSGLGMAIRLKQQGNHDFVVLERDDEGGWLIETDEGEDVSARVLISAMGPLTEPKVPDLPGLDEFEGETWHSARWNHDYDLTGKRVASIGTGASAIQYVPKIQPEVEQLHVFQRTAPWIAPHSSRPIRDWERALYRRVPAAQRLVRGGVYTLRELMVPMLTKRPE